MRATESVAILARRDRTRAKEVTALRLGIFNFETRVTPIMVQKKARAEYLRELDLIFVTFCFLLDLESARAAARAKQPATSIIHVEVARGRVCLPPYSGCRVLLRRAIRRDHNPVSGSRGE